MWQRSHEEAEGPCGMWPFGQGARSLRREDWCVHVHSSVHTAVWFASVPSVCPWVDTPYSVVALFPSMVVRSSTRRVWLSLPPLLGDSVPLCCCLAFEAPGPTLLRVCCTRPALTPRLKCNLGGCLVGADGVQLPEVFVSGFEMIASPGELQGCCILGLIFVSLSVRAVLLHLVSHT